MKVQQPRFSRTVRSFLPRNSASALALLLSTGVSGFADDLPFFDQHPSSQSVPVGVNALFSAQATSDLPVSYQWRVNGADLSGQTDTTLDLFCVSMVQSGYVYSVVATTTAGAVTSSPALLQVSVPDSGRRTHAWGNNPAAQFNSFNPYWLRDRVGERYHADLFDTQLGGLWGTDTYTDDSSLPAAVVHAGFLPAGQRGTVVVRISGPQAGFTGSTRNGITSAGWGGYDGSFQILGVVPTITRHPKAQVRMVGGPVTFAVEAFGNGPLRYQWKHNGAELSGETNATLQFTADSTARAGFYAVSVTDDNGTSTSDPAVLGVLPYTVGSPQTGWGADWGEPGAFARMVITGNTNGGQVWGVGIYTTDMAIAPAVVHDGLLQHDETGVIAVVRLTNQPFFIGDTLNGVTSFPFGDYPSVAFLGRVPNVIADPASQAVLPGRTTRLEVEATYPGGFSIQWRKDGLDIAGATDAKLTVEAGAPDTTTIYDAVVSVPGNPNVTQPAHIVTPPETAQAVTVSNPAEVGAYASQPGFLVSVPLTGTTNQAAVWGTGVYAFGSDLATAAVHAGLLAPGQSAQVTVYTLGYWPGFHGSTRNGMTSISYGGYTAFTFVFPSATPLRPVLTMPSAGTLLVANAVGQVCQIWATPTLSPANWSLLDSFVPTVSPQSWLDTNAPSSQMFYRALLLP